MEKEKGNFKSRVFGGFNRRDVIGYIETLARERNDLARENQSLRGRIEALEERLSELEDRPEEVPVTPKLPAQDELVLARARKILDNAHGILGETMRAYRELCGDLNINAAQAEHELRGVSGKLAALRETLNDAGERLSVLDAELDIMPLAGGEGDDGQVL